MEKKIKFTEVDCISPLFVNIYNIFENDTNNYIMDGKEERRKKNRNSIFYQKKLEIQYNKLYFISIQI